MSKTDSILEKASELLTEKKFYEYEQKLKTLAVRYYNMQKVDDGNELLLSGAKNLLLQNEAASGLGLANLMLDNYKNHSKVLSNQLKKRLVEIFELGPYGRPKLDIIFKILKCFTPGEKDKDLQIILAKEALHNKDYALCQKMIVNCDDTKDLALRMLDEWMDMGALEEREYFITRFVLHKLAANRLEEGKFVFDVYRKAYKTPLMDFLEFLFKGIEIKSKKIFGILAKEYEKPLSKDPTFYVFLRKIASIYFGIQISNESIGETLLKFFIQP